jgi:catechol 2,3-dioxygenase-like lactoylglutathione lyase family enzyme
MFDQQITFLYTRSLEKTAPFYENVLKLPLVRDQGTCRIYKTGETAYLGICERADAPDPEKSSNVPGIIITLVTDDVDAWYEQLKERGVPFEKPPEHNAQYAIYHCFFRDPNGYLIEIQRFDDPIA